MIRKLAFSALLLGLPVAANAQTSDGDSREVFAQAAHEPRGSARSVALYQRYVQLEPDDAWGHLALAEALAAARRFDEAFREIDRAEKLAPGEGDVAIVRTRVNRAHRAALPTVKPTALVTRDSDGNTASAFGINGDISIASTARFGLAAVHGTTATEGLSGSIARGVATFAVVTPALRWTSEVGGAQITHDSSYTTPVGQTHLRWSRGAASPAVDIRVRRAPITAAYSLLRAEALLTEARALVDIPVAGPLKLRATGQLGRVQDQVDPTEPLPTTNRGRRPAGNTTRPYTETNRRIGMGGGVMTQLSATSELGVTAYRMGYEHEGSGNYFAPEFVDILELSSYTEIYRFDPVTIAFDAGVGVQRAKVFHENVGGITPAARFWGQVSIPLSQYLEIGAEIDAYKSQLSTVATSASWSSVSGGLSLRWLISK